MGKHHIDGVVDRVVLAMLLVLLTVVDVPSRLPNVHGVQFEVAIILYYRRMHLVQLRPVRILLQYAYLV